MSLVNGGKVFPVSLQQEGEGGHIVEKKPHEECGQKPFLGQILDEKVVVVAEVEEGLEGVVLGQGAAADVEDDGARLDHDAVTVVADAPAEVNLLHVRKEVVVKAAEGAIDAAAHEQGGAGGPENVGTGVVLPIVFLDSAKNTAAAERYTVAFFPLTRVCRDFSILSPCVAAAASSSFVRALRIIIFPSCFKTLLNEANILL